MNIKDIKVNDMIRIKCYGAEYNLIVSEVYPNGDKFITQPYLVSENWRWNDPKSDGQHVGPDNAGFFRKPTIIKRIKTI